MREARTRKLKKYIRFNTLRQDMLRNYLNGVNIQKKWAWFSVYYQTQPITCLSTSISRMLLYIMVNNRK